MVTLKLIVHKETQKLIYAEAGKDFTDFLCHIPFLPIGNFLSLQVKVKEKDPHHARESDINTNLAFGSFTNIYESMKNLNEQNLFINTNMTNMVSDFANPSTLQTSLQTIFEPSSSSFSSTSGINFDARSYHPVVSPFPGHIPGSNALFNNCIINMNKSGMPYGGYVVETSTYIVMDDLHIIPMSIVSCMNLLNKSGAMDPNKVEEKVVQVGVKEAMTLLRAAMVTRNVLTSVFLEKCKEEEFIVIPE